LKNVKEDDERIEYLKENNEKDFIDAIKLE